MLLQRLCCSFVFYDLLMVDLAGLGVTLSMHADDLDHFCRELFPVEVKLISSDWGSYNKGLGFRFGLGLESG